MGDKSRELEIKLVGAPADVAALTRSPLLAEYADGEATIERLVTTYFDTPYRMLAKKGVSVRLRAEAGRVIQTVKVERRGEGALSRREWERDAPAGATFPSPTGEAEFDAVDSALAGVAPVARVSSDRWTRDLALKKARLEAAVDLGRIENLSAGALLRAAPLAEFELEFVEGDLGAAFKFARRILAAADGRLHVSLLSKGAQARRLGEAGLPPPESALAIDAGASAGDALAAALRQYAARIVDLRPFLADHRLPESAHQMRVALRRLRAVARLYDGALRDDAIFDLARRARDFARAIAPARDWDVFIDGPLANARDRAGESEGFSRLARAADARRATAWASAADACASRDFALFVIDLLKAGHVEGWRKRARARLDMPARAFAEHALDCRLKAARAAEDAAAGGGLNARHRLRLKVKALRYTAQAFRSLYPKEARQAFLSALSELQEELGRMSDAQAAARLAEIAAKGEGAKAARAAGVVAGLYAADAEDAAHRADLVWSRLAGLAPFWRA